MRKHFGRWTGRFREAFRADHAALRIEHAPAEAIKGCEAYTLRMFAPTDASFCSMRSYPRSMW